MSRHFPTLAAPWRSKFLSDLKEMGLPACMLSTVRHHSSSEGKVRPRSRIVVFRGLWAELPRNPRNLAQLNPSSFESDLLTFTTDVRMEKVSDIMSGLSDTNVSGGGAPVEAVFWASPTKTQWRVRGSAYLLGPDIEHSSAIAVRQAIEVHMRPKAADGLQTWSWARELTAHFGNLSPVMRGSFRNPTPGTPRSANSPAGTTFRKEVDDLEDEIARRNFRLIVVIPEEVDCLSLLDPENPRRWNYKLDGNSWKELELWP